MGTDETRIFSGKLTFARNNSVLSQRAMDNQPATNSSRSLLVRLWPWLVVLLVLLSVGFIRFRLLDVPLERDEGEYAYAGQLILLFGLRAGHGRFRTNNFWNSSDFNRGQQSDDYFCFFTGTKTFWNHRRFGSLRELCRDVNQPGGVGNGGAREPLCRFVCGAGDAAAVEGGGIETAERFIFERAALRAGVFDEAAGSVFHFVWWDISYLAGNAKEARCVA